MLSLGGSKKLGVVGQSGGTAVAPVNLLKSEQGSLDSLHPTVKNIVDKTISNTDGTILK
ncbi:hypothetical protein [Nostoc sp.]